MNLSGPVATMRAYAERAMVDRATIERDQGGADDPYGGAPVDWQPHLADQKCKLWVEAGRTAVSEDRTVVVADWSMTVPIDTDVRAGDRVTSVVDHDGNARTDATLYIDHVEHKRDQLVCKLERRS